MVCPRCVDTVEAIFIKNKIETRSIQLGEVVVSQPLTELQKSTLQKNLQQKGFELLQKNTAKLIAQIKTIIINAVHHSNAALEVNFSTLLTQQLHYEYTYLSRLFSSIEHITIEKFIIKQKVERIKEYLFYDELTLSEIAFQMGYSSAAHISAQFKKETGMTPTQFKKIKTPSRASLDSI